MEIPPEIPPPAACNAACHYAEPLRGDYADWIWCGRPGATNRVQASGSDCPWAKREATPAPAADWPIAC